MYSSSLNFVPTSYSLVPIDFLQNVLKRVAISDIRIKKLEEGVKLYKKADINAFILGKYTRFHNCKGWIMDKLESVQAPDLSLIIAELASLNIVVKDFSE